MLKNNGLNFISLFYLIEIGLRILVYLKIREQSPKFE